MSGGSVFLDTNIVLYLLNGDQSVEQHLFGKRLFVSFITELECLGYSGLTTKELKAVERFLSECQLIDINKQIKAETVKLRRTSNLKLPDCIIAASASHLGIPLMTADCDFNVIDDVNIILYDPK